MLTPLCFRYAATALTKSVKHPGRDGQAGWPVSKLVILILYLEAQMPPILRGDWHMQIGVREI